MREPLDESNGGSTSKSQPPLAGRRPSTARAGAGGRRRARRTAACGRRSGQRLHVLSRRPLKWLLLISMVLIMSDREPSIQRRGTKQIDPTWACKINCAVSKPVGKLKIRTSHGYPALTFSLAPGLFDSICSKYSFLSQLG